MLKLMGKKIFTFLRSKILLSKPMAVCVCFQTPDGRADGIILTQVPTHPHL